MGVTPLDMAMERSKNISDEVTEGRSSVRAEEDCVEREGWIANNEISLALCSRVG